jgi:hypothetical protein
MGRSAARIPVEALISLRARLVTFTPRSAGRAAEIARIAELYGVSVSSVYRQLRDLHRPKGLRRADRGLPRALSAVELERYCEIVAALKVRTENGKGRHLSTVRAIELLEEHGVDTPQGRVQAPKGLLAPTTVNRWLRTWGYDHARMTRPPPAVRFEASHSNALWQFDMSPSDLKKIAQPAWIEPGKGTPTLMLFSVVDDRSGAAYQEYRCVYGEDAESALKFFFSAMSKKPDTPLQGIPEEIYMDNGPVARSQVFQTVMERLGVTISTHTPAGKDGRRPTARAKGKVERPFRTVKEAHETLYHFHQPQTEAEANAWLGNFVNRYNDKPHRREPHSRIEDWLDRLPEQGIREMCTWERFCAFAREPERRKVGGDARITVQGTYYEVDPDLAGEDVILWWGLFDHELFVEFTDKRYGPYHPVGGPIPLHRYRSHKKSAREQRADQVATLAEQISIPRTVLSGVNDARPRAEVIPLVRTAFTDPDPWQQLTYASVLDARRGIAALLERPLAKLAEDDLQFVAALVARTLDKAEIATAIRARFTKKRE